MGIVLPAMIIFCFRWRVTRAVGRSTLGELSTFRLLLFVTMGDLIQQAVTQQDDSVTGAVRSVGTFALLDGSALPWFIALPGSSRPRRGIKNRRERSTP